jgi:hypothetical protein
LAAELVVVSPPRGGLYRLSRREAEPFALPDWERAGEDGTFGNRFDDPGGIIGTPTGERFRVVYCSTQRAAAFGETLARFRPSASVRQMLERIDDDEPLVESLSGTVDPEYPTHGLVSRDWIDRRHIGHTCLESTDRFADIAAGDTLSHLNEKLTPMAVVLGLPEVDLSIMTGKHRILTQTAARYIYNQGFSGVRYVSRLDAGWECWALFEGRFHHQAGYPGFPTSLSPDDDDLMMIARRFGLSIELLPGNDHLLRPWMT